MKKRILLTALISVLFVLIFALSVSAAAPLPQKPDLGVDFGTVQTIDGFVAPSEKFVGTDERVLLTYKENEETKYVTYPTYYVTKDSYTFDLDFTKLNAAQSIQFTKASIVMLEIPVGITTLSNSYFSGSTNFAACLSVQVPGTVTSYGSSLFQTNAIIRSVEFLDGTTPVTMGDSMFGSAWNGGANMIGYVKFPNNLTSIGNNTFGKTKGSSKVIILGANLESIGTGFFGEGTPETTDTFIYVSDNFFSETEVFANLFGNYGQYHDNHLKLTIFYAGSQTKAQSLVDACAALQTGYIFNEGNVTIVSASEYDYETHKPKARLNSTIVYDYNECDAFYYSNHQTVEEVNDHDCTTDDSCRCGKVIQAKSADSHNVIFQIVYESYTQNGTKTDGCLNEGCTKTETSVAPIFVTKGYSIKTDGCGITTDYELNIDALNEYVTYLNGNGKSFEFGVFIGNSATFGETFIKDDGSIDNDYAFSQKVTGDNFTRIKCTVADFTTAEADLELVMGLYVIDDGKVSYIQHEGTYEDTVTKGDATLDVVTIVKIAELTNIDLTLPTPKAIPNKED